MKEEEFKAMVQESITKTLEQGESCHNGAGSCMYQYGVNRCSIGHIMTDKEIEEFRDLEADVYQLVREGWQPTLTDSQLLLLSYLQSTHDGIDPELDKEHWRLDYKSSLETTPFLKSLFRSGRQYSLDFIQ